jgi:hypothetical protein
MTRSPTGNAFYAQQQREMRSRSVPRRGLRRPEAATYIGVTVEAFDHLVRAGLMPQPKSIPGVDAPVWDLDALDLFFSALPEARAQHEGRSPSQ